MDIIINLGITLLGLLAGMIVNYAVDNFSENKKIMKPFCWNCKEPQSLFNYFIAPRKCEKCGKSRRTRVFITEIVFVLISLFLWYNKISSVPFILSLILFIYAVFALIMDFETKEVVISILGLLIFGTVGIIIWGWKSAFLGGILSTAIMLGLYYLGKLMVKIMVKKNKIPRDNDVIALGLGDVYLAALLGLSLGFPSFFVGFIITILLGGFVSLVIIIVNAIRRKSSALTAIAYGPYIIISIIFMLYVVRFFVK